MKFLTPPKARPGDRVAVLSPSFAAPGAAPAVHEQALARLVALTGLVPVEYPTTRRLGASARDRAADLNAAFADPERGSAANVWRSPTRGSPRTSGITGTIRAR